MRMRPRMLVSAIVLLSMASIRTQAVDVTYDFSTSDLNWTVSGTEPFFWNATGGIGATGVWQTNGADSAEANLFSPTLTASSTTMTVSLVHRYQFETSFDGGGLLYTITGDSEKWVEPTVNGYEGGTFTFFHNAWNDDSSPLLTLPYKTSIGTITGLNPGDQITFHLKALWDSSTTYQPAWQIASFSATNVTVPEPSTYALGAIATGVLGVAARRRKVRQA